MILKVTAYINANAFRNVGELFRTLVHEFEHHIDYQRMDNNKENKIDDGNYMFTQYLTDNFDSKLANDIRYVPYYLWDDTEFNANADNILRNNFNEVENTYRKLKRTIEDIKQTNLDDNIKLWLSLCGLVSNSKHSTYIDKDNRTKFRGDGYEYIRQHYDKSPQKYNSNQKEKDSLFQRSKRYEAAYIKKHFLTQTYNRLEHWLKVMKKKYMYYQMEYGRKNQFLTEDKIKRVVKKCIRKYINEAMDERFSFEQLKSIPSFKGRLKYCIDTLGFRIGSGSSRTCFQLDDNRILKLAMNEKGIAQNSVEGQRDYYLEGLGVRPEIYNETDFDNNLWIVCEYVLPAKKADFKKVLGITWDEYVDFVFTSGSQQGRGRGQQMLDWETFGNMLENNEQLKAINDYITNYDAPIGDLLRITNYGLSKNNGIVILDTGLDDWVFDNYYR